MSRSLTLLVLLLTVALGGCRHCDSCSRSGASPLSAAAPDTECKTCSLRAER